MHAASQSPQQRRARVRSGGRERPSQGGQELVQVACLLGREQLGVGQGAGGGGEGGVAVAVQRRLGQAALDGEQAGGDAAQHGEDQLQARRTRRRRRGE